MPPCTRTKSPVINIDDTTARRLAKSAQWNDWEMARASAGFQMHITFHMTMARGPQGWQLHDVHDAS